MGIGVKKTPSGDKSNPIKGQKKPHNWYTKNPFRDRKNPFLFGTLHFPMEIVQLLCTSCCGLLPRADWVFLSQSGTKKTPSGDTKNPFWRFCTDFKAIGAFPTAAVCLGWPGVAAAAGFLSSRSAAPDPLARGCAWLRGLRGGDVLYMFAYICV